MDDINSGDLQPCIDETENNQLIVGNIQESSQLINPTTRIEDVITIRPEKYDTTTVEATITTAEDAHIKPSDPMLAQCLEDTCGEHGNIIKLSYFRLGDCEIVNATHIQCSCRDYYDGPGCEHCKMRRKSYVIFSQTNRICR